MVFGIDFGNLRKIDNENQTCLDIFDAEFKTFMPLFTAFGILIIDIVAIFSPLIFYDMPYALKIIVPIVFGLMLLPLIIVTCILLVIFIWYNVQICSGKCSKSKKQDNKFAEV